MKFFQVSLNFSPFFPFDFNFFIFHILLSFWGHIFQFVYILDCRFFLVRSGFWFVFVLGSCCFPFGYPLLKIRLNMTTTIVPTLLNRKNYDDWSSRIKSHLLAEDLWDVVERKYDNNNNEALRKKDAKALYAIENSCGKDAYKLIKDADTANGAWDTLQETLRPAYNRSSDEQGMKTIVEAYMSLTLTPLVVMEEGRTGGHDNIRETFVKYVESNDWDNAIEFLSQHRQLGSERIFHDRTALHCAVNGLSKCSVRNMEQLMELMAKKDLAIQDIFGCTALHDAVCDSREFSVRIVEKLVDLMEKKDLAIQDFRCRTALHNALCEPSKLSVRIVKKLVDLMEKEDLAIQDDLGRTALHYLVREYPERVEVAKCMVDKNYNLPTIFTTSMPPVVVAEMQEKGKRMARYLYSLTPRQTLRVRDGAQLISSGFLHKRFDIVWDLIQRYPLLTLAKDHNGDFPLVTLVKNRSAFLSGSQLTLWEKLIYYGIRIKPLPPINENGLSDQRPLSNQKKNQRHLISSGIINRIYEMKLMHERVHQFLPLIFKAATDVVPSVSTPHIIEGLHEALRVAAECGHAEYFVHRFNVGMDESFKSNDDVYSISLNDQVNRTNQSMFHIAAECRHHKLYNLIYVIHELSQEKKEDKDGQKRFRQMQGAVGRKDYFGNNVLHTVASITSVSRIDHIRGAALQMQRELQWFKEVESVTDPKDRECLNDDGMTPQELFKENHKKMGEEAEKSMKETATSCTVVGALIVTIMFAAAFTVPGGNDEKTSLPKFLTKKVFTAFIVSDAISLFSSTTSVIMFLGILTSRYSEDDFFKSLPTKMIIGLFTLFLSITTMMIVFSCALYIMLDGKSSIVIPIILIASVPVASFISMQFPLLVDIFIFTYGPSMFGENNKTWFKFLCDLY
ncbi:hypothetical protein ACFX2I_045443 [Malus domestica]